MFGQNVVASIDTPLTNSSLGDTPMLSQKTKKDFFPDSHFGRSFALSLVSIVMLTLALPLLTSAIKIAPGNVSEPTTSVKSVAK
jgi:hypothetical protein